MEQLFVNNSVNAKKRPDAHIVGEQAVALFKQLLPRQWATREYVPDYGIDLDVELFSESSHQTLGEHILVQVKGEEFVSVKKLKVQGRFNVEVSDKKNNDSFEIDVVQHQIDTHLLATVEEMGSAVPVLLAVVDLLDKKAYLICLNDYIEKVIVPNNPEYQIQGSVTINIPIENAMDAKNGREIIEWYAKRAKLYAFFNKVNYQKSELEYCSCPNEKVALARRFARILGRLDVWSAGEYWYGIKRYQEELLYFYEHGMTKFSASRLETLKKAGEDIEACVWTGTYCNDDVSLIEINAIEGIHHLWEDLNGLAHLFEEVLKVSYLPTWLTYTMKG